MLAPDDEIREECGDEPRIYFRCISVCDRMASLRTPWGWLGLCMIGPWHVYLAGDRIRILVGAKTLNLR